MAIKKILLNKNISGAIHDIYPKTSADVVVYGETNVAEALNAFADDLLNIYTKTEADSAIKASVDELYNKIMGITSEDGASVTEAYDTLKEVAAWIDAHGDGDIADSFITDINDLKNAIGDEDSGLISDISNIYTDISNIYDDISSVVDTVGDDEHGLVKDVIDIKSDISDLQNTIGDLEAVSGDSVSASETNGNVLVNGDEVTVYTHPETHDAAMITEDEEHKFVTSEEKDIINNAAAIVFVTDASEIDNERDLYLVEIPELNE